MSSWHRSIAALVLAAATLAAHAQGTKQFPGIGRDATPQEVAAWDIDVRADFKGLPAGSGSVAKGQQVWEAKCASCHGVFGESNQVFHPLVGGTTQDDIRTGRVANLKRIDYPARTTLMKLPTLSTLWDYIHRAMPWNEPKSLSVEEVYAVTAYMLHLGDIVPAGFTLSDRNIREVQQRMPNRNGMQTGHAMWPGPELRGAPRPDAMGSGCMANCAVEPKVASLLPDFARDAHGNLAQQNRGVGPQRGVDTSVPAGTSSARSVAPAAAPVAAAALAAGTGAADTKAVLALVQKNNCTACHAAQQRLVGPSWQEVARRHEGKADHLAGKIRSGSSGAWGSIPMPPQALNEADARRIAEWLAAGAKP
jgi:cytochrome c